MCQYHLCLTPVYLLIKYLASFSQKGLFLKNCGYTNSLANIVSLFAIQIRDQNSYKTYPPEKIIPLIKTLQRKITTRGHDKWDMIDGTFMVFANDETSMIDGIFSASFNKHTLFSHSNSAHMVLNSVSVHVAGTI